MFSLKKIEQLEYAKILNGFLFYRIDKTILTCRHLESDEIVFQSKIPENFLQEYQFIHKGIYYIKGFRDAFAIDLKTGKKSMMPCLIIYKDTGQNDEFFFNDTRNKKIGIINVVTKTIIWELPKSKVPTFKKWANSEIIITSRETVITVLNRKNGKILFQKNLSTVEKLIYKDHVSQTTKGKIKEILGVANDQIFLSVNDDCLASLNIHNGEITNVIRHLPNGVFWTNGKKIVQELPPTYGGFLLPNSNKIIGLSGKSFWEYMIKENSISLTNLSNVFDDFGANVFSAQKICLIDNCLVFISKESQIMAFDIVRKKITWHYDFEFKESGNCLKSRFLTISEGWMFTTDKLRNGYIFKRNNH